MLFTGALHQTENKPIEILPQRLSSEEACLQHALGQYHGTICTWFTRSMITTSDVKIICTPCNQENKT